MANWCSFDMMVRGKPKDVDTFYRYMTDYDGSPKYFARIFRAEIEGDSVSADGARTVRISGDCAWSVWSCMCDGPDTYYSGNGDGRLTCLREASSELCLEVEIRSTEPGFGFWEHYHYKNGECLRDDTGSLQPGGFEMDDVA